jgi:hypothetical protein
MFGVQSLRLTSGITLFFFVWLTLQPLRALAEQPAAPTPPAASVEDALDDLRDTAEQAEAKATRSKNNETEKNRLLKYLPKLDGLESDAEADFAEVEAHIKTHQLPAEIQTRHQAAVAEFRAKMGELKRYLHELDLAHGKKDRVNEQRALNDLATFLKKEQKRKPHQPFDPKNLPFGTPNEPGRAVKEKKEELEPLLHSAKPIQLAANELTPGLLAQTTLAPSLTPAPGDLAETEDVQITQAIKFQAAALHHNPVEIWNWVRNTIEFVPTYGSIQGSDLTLQTQRGNAFDTASLLIALLRASGIPARYVYGTIQVPAEQVINWLGGVTTPEAAQNLLGQGGIPTTAIVSGGKIAAFKLEHVWVSAFVDYLPSRGAVNRVGDTWVPLDGSFKQHDFTAPLNVAEIAGFDVMGDLTQALQTASLNAADASVTGVDEDFLRSRWTAYQEKLAAYSQAQPNPLTLDQAFGGKAIRKANYPILMGTLPYVTVAESSRVATLPDSLRHAVRLEFFTSDLDRGLGSPALVQTLSLPRLRQQRLGVTYVPASADDAAVLQSLDAANADTIPLYLIRVKPQIKLDDTVVVEGAAIGMGADHYLDVVVSKPGGARRLSFSRIAGDEMVLGVDAAGITSEQVSRRFQAMPADTAAENLHQLALHYWAESDLLDRLSQTAYGVTAVRLPSVGVFSSPLSVIYSFGIPRTGYYLKRNIDIKLSHHAVAGSDRNKTKDYIGHTGAIMSYLESSIQEQLFHNWQGTGLSTMQVFLDANTQRIPLYTLTAANAPALLSRLQIPVDAQADIQAAMAAGYEVIVSERTPTKAVGVAGIGYQIRDPQTGSASYRIWGGTDGGDGDTPCGERQRRPLTQVVKDVVLTVLVLEAVVLAGWYLPGLIGGAGGIGGVGVAGGFKAALTAIMASVGLTALSFPATAGAVFCNPNPIPRKGGDDVHEQCATARQGNLYPGRDVCVATPQYGSKAFDAYNGSVIWEVKTYNFDNMKSPSFLLSLDRDEWIKESAIARYCRISFWYTVGDARHMEALNSVQPGFVPIIADNIEVDPGNCLQPTIK